MVRASSVLLALCLGACAFSDTIKQNAISYDDVFEDTTDKLLLVNVLRARDKAPLHFADIPLIHQSLQVQAGAQASLPVGPLMHSTTRDTITPSFAVQSTPSFDIDHLDQKEFVTGIASPIDPKFVKYWLDRGVDQSIVLLLFFSSAEIVDNTADEVIQVTNTPRESADRLTGRDKTRQLRCDGLEHTQFELYLSIVDSLKSFYATSYPAKPRIIATGFPQSLTADPRNFKQIAALDPTKVKLQLDKKTNTYTLYSVSTEQKIALCYKASERENTNEAMVKAAAPVSGVSPPASACKSSQENGAQYDAAAGETPSTPKQLQQIYPEGMQSAEYCRIFKEFRDSGGTAKNLELRLAIRSVGEMIQFLGDLLYYQQQVPADRWHHVPVTLRFCPTEPKDLSLLPSAEQAKCRNENEGGYLFRLSSDASYARFTLRYRGSDYSVREFALPQGAPGAAITDHTLEVLGIVHQLVDLNKSATELKTTPYVQTLP